MKDGLPDTQVASFMLTANATPTGLVYDFYEWAQLDLYEYEVQLPECIVSREGWISSSVTFAGRRLG